MKKAVCILTAFLVGLVLVACGGGAAAPATPDASSGDPATSPVPADDTVYTIKLAHQANETHPWVPTVDRIKELVAERTGGKVVIEQYIGGSLGYDRDLIEGMQAGTVDMAFVTTAPMASFVPEIGVLDLPYVFNDWDHLQALMGSAPAQELADKMQAVGIRTYSFFPGGFRNTTNNKGPINTLTDIKGMKIRVMQSDVFIDTFTALGASPVPMAWGEVPTSLQQGTIDGQENPNLVNVSNNIWEYQKYYSLTQHTAYMSVLLGSEKLMSKLPEEYQKIIADAALEACIEHVQGCRDNEPVLLQQMADNGMLVNEVDTADFLAATQSVRDAFATKNGGEIMQAIIDLGK
jgi:tripartite ATP-independent transporter DctP family solute receptor